MICDSFFGLIANCILLFILLNTISHFKCRTPVLRNIYRVYGILTNNFKQNSNLVPPPPPFILSSTSCHQSSRLYDDQCHSTNFLWAVFVDGVALMYKSTVKSTMYDHPLLPLEGKREDLWRNWTRKKNARLKVDTNHFFKGGGGSRGLFEGKGWGKH